MDGKNLRLLFGVKLKNYRQAQNFTLKVFSERTGLSISYLSEIEKGKKYPKPEKMMVLAESLGITYDELVSLKVSEELDPISAFLNASPVREFPFHVFGIKIADIVDLATNSPTKAGAFLRTLLDIAETYDLTSGHFLLAALRSFQILNQNHFEDLEEAADRFLREYGFRDGKAPSKKALTDILHSRYLHNISEDDFAKQPELQRFRSVLLTHGRQPHLLINKNLLPSQKAFVLGRELGYCYLDLKHRSTTSSWIKVESFDQVLDNFKASYFAGALLLQRKPLVRDLKRFLKMPTWQGDAFLDLISSYKVTPEIFLYRICQLLPPVFGLNNLFYLRFTNRIDSDEFVLSKELNLSKTKVPRGIGLPEHYCRRWMAIRLLKDLATQQKNGGGVKPLISVQRAKLIDSQNELFVITLARPMALTDGKNSSMTLGFVLDDNFKNTARFWNDPAIDSIEVNETCERCRLTQAECSDRVAPAIIHAQKQKRQQREDALRILNEKLGKPGR